MPSSRLPKVSDCVRQLWDKRRTPDAAAPRVNETVLNLVRAYGRHFAHVCGKAKQHESTEESLERCKHAADTARQQFAICCLQDLNATAALVKDIAFTDVPLNEDDSVECVDLGAGTGILSVGAAVAALRNGAKKVVLHLVDCEKPLLAVAEKTMQCVGNGVECQTHEADIREGDFYDKVDACAIRFWISETISHGTPPLRILKDRVWWEERGTYRMDIDPFPDVVHNLTTKISDFIELVRGQRVRMFPDIFNDRYQPGQKNVLQLPSSNSHRTHGPLKTVGQDFDHLNPKNDYMRW